MCLETDTNLPFTVYGRLTYGLRERTPGSTFFVMYTRDQSYGFEATDQLMAKLTYYWLG